MKKEVKQTKKVNKVFKKKTSNDPVLFGVNDFYSEAERYARNCETNIFIAELKNQYCC